MRDKGLNLLYLWRSGKGATWMEEHGADVHWVPEQAQESSSRHEETFLADLLNDFTQAKNPGEYAAGFRARLAEIPSAEPAHTSWRAGWEDADTELLEEARNRRWLEEGREDGFLGTGRLLYDAGCTARENGLLFDEGRTEPWKTGWIAADIQFGAEPAF